MWLFGLMTFFSIWMFYKYYKSFNEKSDDLKSRADDVYLMIVFGASTIGLIWMMLGAPGYTPNA